MSRITEARNPQASDTVLWQGHRPRMASAALAFSQAVYQESTLSLREAEAARFRIAVIVGCAICQGFRVADGLEELLARLGNDEAANLAARGAAPGPEFYAAVANWRSSDLLNPRERLAAEYAERLDQSPKDLPHDDDFWTRLHAAYDDGEIVDLTYSITAWIATSRFVHGLGLDGACPMQAPQSNQCDATKVA